MIIPSIGATFATYDSADVRIQISEVDNKIPRAANNEEMREIRKDLTIYIDKL